MNPTSTTASARQSAPQRESDNPRSNNRVVLRKRHFEQPWQVRYWPLLLVLIAGALYVGVLGSMWWQEGASKTATASTKQPAESESKAIPFAAALFAMGAFYVGYHQWQAARQESAMEQYYSRLEIANQRLSALPGTDPMDLYVFAELDTLEYVIEKYRMGYMNARQALRGLEAFERRLYDKHKGPRFAALAEQHLNGSGYNATTRRVAEKVIEDWKKKTLLTHESPPAGVVQER